MVPLGLQRTFKSSPRRKTKEPLRVRHFLRVLRGIFERSQDALQDMVKVLYSLEQREEFYPAMT